MQRYLVGFVFSIALLAAGTASALVITSGEFPVIDHEHRPGSVVTGFGSSVVPTDIQLFPCLPGLPQFRLPFEWPEADWWREPDSWKGILPFFADFLIDSFGSWLQREDDVSLRSPVPEPTTALLFGTGLLGLALMRRRQR